MQAVAVVPEDFHRRKRDLRREWRVEGRFFRNAELCDLAGFDLNQSEI